MADEDIPRILGEEKSALQKDLSHLKYAINELRVQRTELANEEQQLEELEKIILATSKSLDELTFQSLKIMGNARRSDNDVEEFVKNFLVLKTEVNLINRIWYVLNKSIEKEQEAERTSRPLVHAIYSHSTRLIEKIHTIQKGVFGMEDNHEVDMNRDLPKFVQEFSKRHPLRS